MDASFLVVSVLRIVFVLIIVVGVLSPLLAWADRRLAAMLQDRLGPVRANIRVGSHEIRLQGLLHPLADAIKFMWKEDFVPPKADKLLHALAPLIALAPGVAAFAVLPFGAKLYPEYLLKVLPSQPSGPGIALQIASLNFGVLYVFALGGVGVVGSALAGYASDNKYALLGGLRAASQMVSYEVTFGLTLVPCFMLYNSLRLEAMVDWQVAHGWGILYQPLAFFLFLFASIAESKRVPFDIPEGESELAAGYFTEYSGMKFVMFYMSEYIACIVACFMMAALFFGGYHVPFVTPDGIRFELFGHQFSDAYLPLRHLTVTLINTAGFLIKVVLLLWLQLVLRWSLPRFRYDQVMKLCWRYMLPLSLFNVFVTAMVVMLRS